MKRALRLPRSVNPRAVCAKESLEKAVFYRNPDNDPKGPYLLADITTPFQRPNLSFEWHGRRPPEHRSWKYDAETLARLEREGRIVIREGGLPRLRRYQRASAAAIPSNSIKISG